MNRKNIPEKLKIARRSLDMLPQIAILNDWDFDNNLEYWYLRLAITINPTNNIIDKVSNWYIVVEPTYPFGIIKVFPDVINSLSITFPHQANNTKIESNNLWRSGSLCLELNTFKRMREDTEPYLFVC